MKVLMFGWEFPPYSTGGLGTHCYGLTRGLQRLGVETVFVMPGAPEGIRSDFARIVQAGVGKLIRVASYITPYVASAAGGRIVSASARIKAVYGMDFFNEVRRYTEMASDAVKDECCDVIHCHDWMTFGAGIRAKESKGRSLIVSVHSTEYDRCPLAPNQDIVKAEWEGMYRADRVITVSEYEKRVIMERYAVPEGKIDVVHNAVDAGSFGRRHGFGLDEKVVLFLGRVTLQKGPDYFLEAAGKVLDVEDNVRFVVVGSGDMLHEMVRRSIRMGISDRVHFTGYVDSIEDYYGMADLYVMPSVSEPFGITALEAASSGTPVIVSKQSGVSEVLHHCMKVDFWDTDLLASKIVAALRYSPVRREMGRNGQREAAGMGWDAVAAKTLDIYSRLAS
jgi:glycogen(starch) synthase